MFISVDGAQLFAADDGRGDAVVLLHGFPLRASLWDAQTLALAPAHRVIRPDLRGLGRSQATPGPYLMEQLAGDVAAQLDALGVGSVAIAGHSLGGYVALAFYRLFSERVRSLALIASRAGADSPQAAAARENLAAQAERDGMDAIEKAFIPRYFAPDFYDREPAAVQAVREVIRATDPRGAAAMLRGMAQRYDSSDILPEVTVPVLVIGAREDAIVSRAEVELMAGSLPNVRTQWLACGHMPMIEAPAELSAALSAWFARR